MLDLLADTGKMGVKPCSTTMTPSVHLVKEDTNSFQDPERYRRLVGKLSYLIVTRPDIAHIVSVLSQYLHLPSNIGQLWNKFYAIWKEFQDLACCTRIKDTRVLIVLQMLTGLDPKLIEGPPQVTMFLWVKTLCLVEVRNKMWLQDPVRNQSTESWHSPHVKLYGYIMYWKKLAWNRYYHLEFSVPWKNEKHWSSLSLCSREYWGKLISTGYMKTDEQLED